MSFMSVHYLPTTDFVGENSKYQGVNPELSEKDMMKVAYPGNDNLKNSTINDDFIYLSTTDRQHEKYASGHLACKEDHTAFSGYFTSETTAKSRVNDDGTFDSYGFHRDVCVSPTNFATESGELMDKRHLDCFYIDRARMEDIYGTRDFNAAIGKCSANNQYGSDGGDQGYNASLTELYNNGCLKYAGTYDADPASTIKCKSEYDSMQDARQEKCSAIISGQSPEEIQKIGCPLDERCHQKTAFNAHEIDNLDVAYANYSPTYNKAMADATSSQDRIYNNSQTEGIMGSRTGTSSSRDIDVFADLGLARPSAEGSSKSSGLSASAGIQ